MITEKNNNTITGFSKLSKDEKLDWLIQHYLSFGKGAKDIFTLFSLEDQALQKIIDGFSENTISNFVMPYGLAPNFFIDGEVLCVPMVIEESSVIAAASSAAKYWMDRGGFKTTILGTVKVGQVHFKWYGD
ncbi:MAG: hydroxymethylglutaryl-CoA reductase, partial [Bacteroidota bacterium]